MNKLFFLLLFFPVLTNAQSVTRPGAANNMSQDRGGIGADSVVRLPLTTVRFPNVDSARRIGILSGGNLAVHNGTVWNEQLPVKDSTRYVTPASIPTRITSYVNTDTRTVSSASTLSLSTGGWFVFTGTTSTWTLPGTSLYSGSRAFFIKNRGSGALTINSNTGGNDIYDTAPASTISIPAGEARIIFFDGTYFNIE